MLFYVISDATILTCAVVANVFLLFVLCRNWAKLRHSRVNIFIAHLAGCDLLISCTTMTFGILLTASDRPWRFGLIPCKIIRYMEVLAPSASSFLLVSMTVDRYHAIVQPLASSLAHSNAHKFALLSWLAALVLSAPQFYAVGIDGDGHCNIQQFWVESVFFKLYLGLVFVAIFYGPVGVFVFCYSRIVYTLKKAAAAHTRPLTATGSNGVNTSYQRYSSARGKAVRMSFAVILCYVLCWGPYFTMAFLCHFLQVCPSEHVFMASQIFTFLNSVTNPLVYGYFNLTPAQVLNSCRWVLGRRGATPHSQAAPDAQRGAGQRGEERPTNHQHVPPSTEPATSKVDLGKLQPSESLVLINQKANTSFSSL